jgi:phage repressor protein C with HTH and peptisase S24 domain
MFLHFYVFFKKNKPYIFKFKIKIIVLQQFLKELFSVKSNIDYKIKTNNFKFQINHKNLVMNNDKNETNDKKVNQKFAIVFDQLKKDGKVKSKSHIASMLGTYNHVINNVLKGERGLTVEQINKLVELFNIDANFLFGSSIKIYAGEEGDTASYSFEDQLFKDRNNITLVPHKAAAGYAMSGGTQEYMNEFQKFSLPGFEGQLVAFEISGDSMLPHITNGDIVICEALERNEIPRDNGVYVVITDNVVAKRIRRIKDRNSSEIVGFELISDNSVYHPYTVEIEEIRQILKVKTRLTAYGLA